MLQGQNAPFRVVWSGYILFASKVKNISGCISICVSGVISSDIFRTKTIGRIRVKFIVMSESSGLFLNSGF